ncbi:hypothetical protein [Cupriavidus malaysiensis]|uniref:hypothetical protein n=1 Tax=Cupriavidus malaysiensis TaxID=367825 RepID=UPI0012FF5C9E|nr:hypothetical protein [Cupriavidus malaysiensis]
MALNARLTSTLELLEAPRRLACVLEGGREEGRKGGRDGNAGEGRSDRTGIGNRKGSAPKPLERTNRMRPR